MKHFFQRHHLIHNKSLRNQILAFTMCLILCGTFVIGGAFFLISKSIVYKNQIETTGNAIRHAAYTVEQDLDHLTELMGYLFVDNQLHSALEKKIDTAYDQALQWNQINTALSTYERLEYFRYVNCIVIYNAEGYPQIFRYMDLDDEDYLERNQTLGWYEAALQEEGSLLWGTDVTENPEDYLFYSETIGNDISLMRALRDHSYTEVQGVAYVSIRPAFFSVMQQNNSLEGMDVYLIDDAQRLLNPQPPEKDVAPYLEQLEDTPWASPNFRHTTIGEEIVYEYQIATYQYRLIVVQHEPDVWSMDNGLWLLGVVIFFLLLFVALSLWIFLTRVVIRPVNDMVDTMKRVHSEGLSVRTPRGGSREFDYLAENFNRMLQQIQDLMQKNLEKEREVQEAEHKAVLAQINPHFVYNALFAIRMMAIIQKAENIQDMVDALWRMLKNSTTRAKKDFSLADEIQNVKDYIHILCATNVQKFQVVYQVEEELLGIQCPKFLIQPVVENAMMHGVLPKQGFSTIEIQAQSQGEDVVITVSNDGLPISAERLAEVTTSLHKETAAHKGLGLSSIRRRLQLLYGDRADLSISSDPEQGKTMVTIRYPKEKGEQHV